MTKLEGDSCLKREIRVPGIDSPISVEINAVGLVFWVKGSKKKVSVAWKRVIEAGHTGTDVPSFLMSKPLELLMYQTAKAQRRTQ